MAVLAWPPARHAAFGCLPALSGGGAAAAACAARRAAAMKLDVLTGSFGAAAGILLMAFSEAAMRSDGEATRAGRPRARFKRVIGRQVRGNRNARRRCMRLQNFADGAGRDDGRLCRRGGMEIPRGGREMLWR